MARSGWWKVATVLLAAGATTDGTPCLARKNAAAVAPDPAAGAQANQAGQTPVAVVKPGKLRATIAEWGLLEATRSSRGGICLVEGGATILRILPEGTRVAKGQIVCELDSASTRASLVSQRIAVQVAEVLHKNALLAREAAESGLREYEQGIRPQLLNTLVEEVNAARKAILKSEERLNQLRPARKRLDDFLAAKGTERSAAEIVADLLLTDRLDDVERTLGRERSTLGRAESALSMFERFGGPKRTLELKSEFEKARADELSKRSAWEQEKAKEAKLGKQVESCKIVAPADGEIVYANREGRAVPAGQSWPLIEEGAMIRERQPIFSILDLSGPMRVNVKVPEWSVDWIKPGLPARIQVEGSDGEELPGLVESIAPLPEAASFVNRQIRSYTTFVAIQKMPAGLAPGMPALVKIPTTELDDVLVVPASTPVYYDHKDHVAVRRPDGGYDWRQVTLGLSDGAMVEVKEGLKGGEVIALEPEPLLSGGQKVKISRSTPKPPPRPARLANPAQRKGRADPVQGPAR